MGQPLSTSTASLSTTHDPEAMVGDSVSAQSSLPFPILILRSMQKASNDPAGDVQMAPPAPNVSLWCMLEGTPQPFQVSVPLGTKVHGLKKKIEEVAIDTHLRLFQVCHLPASIQLIAQQSDRSTLISTEMIFNPSETMIVKSRLWNPMNPSLIVGVCHSMKVVSMS
jgi:hypothetical protein